MKIMAGTPRAFIIVCSFFFPLHPLSSGWKPPSFLPFLFFFFIIRDSVNRRSSNETILHSSPLFRRGKKDCWRDPSYFSSRNFVKHRRVFILLRVTHWYVKQLWHVLLFAKRRSLCIDVSLRRNVSFFIIIIRGINNAKDACTNYKILVKRNLSSCIYKSPNEINFHESSKIDKYSSSSCQYIYEAESREFCEFGFVFP